MPTMWVPASELEDYKKMLDRLGYSDDFSITDAPAELSGRAGGIQPLTNEITIHCKASGINRTYLRTNTINYDHSPVWVREIERDIRNGCFVS